MAPGKRKWPGPTGTPNSSRATSVGERGGWTARGAPSLMGGRVAAEILIRCAAGTVCFKRAGPVGQTVLEMSALLLRMRFRHGCSPHECALAMDAKNALCYSARYVQHTERGRHCSTRASVYSNRTGFRAHQPNGPVAIVGWMGSKSSLERRRRWVLAFRPGPTYCSHIAQRVLRDS